MGLAAYAVALALAALSVGGMLFLLGRLLPESPAELLAAAVAAPAALHAGGAVRRLPQSSWRVPRNWERFGRVPTAALFGLALGAGVFTAMPSTGFYLLAAWALAADAFGPVAVVFGAFAAGRAAPLLFIAAVSRRLREHPVATIERFADATPIVAHVEAGLIMAMAAALCVSAVA